MKIGIKTDEEEGIQYDGEIILNWIVICFVEESF